MTDMSSIKRCKLKWLFRVGGRDMLHFTDHTFREFFEEHAHRNIDAAVYRERSTSKVSRLCGFWKVESNHLVW